MGGTTHTFARREALKSVLAQREQLTALEEDARCVVDPGRVSVRGSAGCFVAGDVHRCGNARFSGGSMVSNAKMKALIKGGREVEGVHQMCAHLFEERVTRRS